MNKEEITQMIIDEYLDKGERCPFNSVVLDRSFNKFENQYKPTDTAFDFNVALSELTWEYERHGFAVGLKAAFDLMKVIKEW